MGRIWILEEQGNKPCPSFSFPVEWSLTIDFATEGRSRCFKLLGVIPNGDDTLFRDISIDRFDEWNW